MKVALCRGCKDMQKIRRNKRTCACGKTTFWFTGERFFIRGPGVIVSHTNESLEKALAEYDKKGSSRAIETVIPPKK